MCFILTCLHRRQISFKLESTASQTCTSSDFGPHQLLREIAGTFKYWTCPLYCRQDDSYCLPLTSCLPPASSSSPSWTSSSLKALKQTRKSPWGISCMLYITLKKGSLGTLEACSLPDSSVPCALLAVRISLCPLVGAYVTSCILLWFNNSSIFLFPAGGALH